LAASLWFSRLIHMADADTNHCNWAIIASWGWVVYFGSVSLSYT